MTHNVDFICTKLRLLREKEESEQTPSYEMKDLTSTFTISEISSEPSSILTENCLTAGSPINAATSSTITPDPITGTPGIATESDAAPNYYSPDLSALSSWLLQTPLPQLVPTLRLLPNSQTQNQDTCSLIPLATQPLNTLSSSLPPVDFRLDQLASISALRNVSSGNKDEFRRDFMVHFETRDSCPNAICHTAKYDEHFHCIICHKLFTKKDDAMRDMKAHEKQLKSWQFNCARFGHGEDCIEESCQFQYHQTHYHCLEAGCPRVFTNTGEIQIHFNNHQKINALRREGFQRFRTLDVCPQANCSLRGERTTHFHCIRPGCNYGFKHKADMEKHKVHHNKNIELAEDGFRKFYKYEECSVKGCELSKKLNHMHCIREGCNYLLNSVNMILSHKRRHEKQDPLNSINEISSNLSCIPPNVTLRDKTTADDEGALDLTVKEKTDSIPKSGTPQTSDINPNQGSCIVNANRREHRPKNYDYSKFLQNFTRRFTANDPCSSRCQFLYQNHYHCLAENETCPEVMRGKQQIREHGREHAMMEEVVAAGFKLCRKTDCSCSTSVGYHYHCCVTGCDFQELPSKSRLLYNHAKEHHTSGNKSESTTQIVSGHPNRLKRHINNLETNGSSSKRQCLDNLNVGLSSLENLKEKTHNESSDDFINNCNWSHLSVAMFVAASDQTLVNFKLYRLPKSCANSNCALYNSSEHFHCMRLRCSCAVESLNEVRHHCVDFHSQVNIPEGIEAYNFNINCQISNCPYKKALKHYHCLSEMCYESFYREKTMYQHSVRHKCSTSQVLHRCKTTNSTKTEPNYSSSIALPKLLNTIESPNLTKCKDTPSKTLLNNKSKLNNSKEWSEELLKHYCIQGSCILPFCKLKRNEHYHCNHCNAGISRADRFISHLRKHKANLTHESASSSPS